MKVLIHIIRGRMYFQKWVTGNGCVRNEVIGGALKS